MKMNFTWPFNTSAKNSGGGFLEIDRNYGGVNYRIAICIIQVIICFTGLLGNSAILITIWKTSPLHLSANVLLVCLAVSDLAVSLVSQPLSIANVLSQKAILKLLVGILVPFLNTASFMTVTAIGVDRFLVLQLHLRYKAQVTVFRAAWAVVFIWLFSGISGTTNLWISAGLCETLSSATIVSLLVGNFVVYLKIYLIVRRHHKQIQQQRQAINPNTLNVKRFQKTALNTFLVFILLVCCYMPHTVVLKMAAAGMSITPRIYSMTITFICLNSSLNPVLYCWRDREIRSAIKQVFCH